MASAIIRNCTLIIFLFWGVPLFAQDTEEFETPIEETIISEPGGAPLNSAPEPHKGPALTGVKEIKFRDPPKKKRQTQHEEVETFDLKQLDTKERKFVPHPFAKKGLTKITKDLDYKYKVPVSPQTKAMSVRFGAFEPTSLLSSDQAVAYSDIYDTGNPMLFVDYEWQIFRSLGKLGVRVGTGLLMATGQGRLQSGGTALEGFTFLMFPNSISAVYRLQLWDRQPVVPFAEGGAGYYTFAELRDDNAPPKLGGAATAHYAVGGALDLGMFGRDTIFELDRDYGINSVWLMVEYRSVIGLKDDFDLSFDTVSAGLHVEF